MANGNRNRENKPALFPSKCIDRRHDGKIQGVKRLAATKPRAEPSPNPPLYEGERSVLVPEPIPAKTLLIAIMLMEHWWFRSQTPRRSKSELKVYR